MVFLTCPRSPRGGPLRRAPRRRTAARSSLLGCSSASRCRTPGRGPRGGWRRRWRAPRARRTGGPRRRWRRCRRPSAMSGLLLGGERLGRVTLDASSMYACCCLLMLIALVERDDVLADVHVVLVPAREGLRGFGVGEHRSGGVRSGWPKGSESRGGGSRVLQKGRRGASVRAGVRGAARRRGRDARAAGAAGGKEGFEVGDRFAKLVSGRVVERQTPQVGEGAGRGVGVRVRP
jgi:hypothetical protein